MKRIASLVNKFIKLSREDQSFIVHDWSAQELLEDYKDQLKDATEGLSPTEAEKELNSFEEELDIYLKKHEEILIHEPGQWENDTGPEGWYAISNNDGIFAYACTLEKAKRIKETA